MSNSSNNSRDGSNSSSLCLLMHLTPPSYSLATSSWSPWLLSGWCDLQRSHAIQPPPEHTAAHRRPMHIYAAGPVSCHSMQQRTCARNSSRPGMRQPADINPVVCGHVARCACTLCFGHVCSPRPTVLLMCCLCCYACSCACQAPCTRPSRPPGVWCCALLFPD
jgi:hypothetical protein